MGEGIAVEKIYLKLRVFLLRTYGTTPYYAILLRVAVTRCPAPVWGYVDVAYSSGLADRVTRADRRTKVIISRSHSGEDVGKLISGALGDKTDVLTAGGAGQWLQ